MVQIVDGPGRADGLVEQVAPGVVQEDHVVLDVVGLLVHAAAGNGGPQFGTHL